MAFDLFFSGGCRILVKSGGDVPPTPIPENFRGKRRRVQAETKRSIDIGPSISEQYNVKDMIMNKSYSSEECHLKDLGDQISTEDNNLVLGPLILGTPSVELIVPSQEDIFEIEKVVESRGKGKNKQLYIKWKGYEEKTWFPERDIDYL